MGSAGAVLHVRAEQEISVKLSDGKREGAGRNNHIKIFTFHKALFSTRDSGLG